MATPPVGNNLAVHADAVGSVGGPTPPPGTKSQAAAPPAEAPQPSADAYLPPCRLPLWYPPKNCGYAQDTPLPGDLPWDLSHVSSAAQLFLARIATQLDRIKAWATNETRARVIFDELLALGWGPVEIGGKRTRYPSGYTAAEMLAHPVGNCTDATNLVYAVLKYFNCPCFIAYVVTENAENDHMCVGISGDDGAALLVDLTQGEAGFGAQHNDWYELPQREFLAQFFTHQGIAADDTILGDRDPAQAHALFLQADQACPGEPLAMSKRARYHTSEPGFMDLERARTQLTTLNGMGMASGELSYAWGGLAFATGDLTEARRYYDEVLVACPAGSYFFNAAGQRLSEVDRAERQASRRTRGW